MTDRQIYVGIREIGDMTIQLAEAFRKMGFSVTNVVVDRSHKDHLPFGREGYQFHDDYISRSNNIAYLRDITKEFLTRTPTHDIFLFINSTSFYGDLVYKPVLRNLAYFDLPILQLLGRKVGVIANGSEIRSYDQLLDLMDEAGLGVHLHYWQKDLSDILESKPIIERRNRLRASRIQQFSDVVFSSPINGQYLDDYKMAWVPVNVNKLEYNTSQSSTPQIIHAPTNRGIKGTKYVTEAVEQLRKDNYDFTFKLVENMPNPEFRKTLTESQIVVDQLLLPSYGLLAIEAMATGNAVLGSAVPGFNGFPEEIPIKTTTPDTIYENLRYLIENPSERIALSQQGRQYVEQHHHHTRVAKYILDSLEVDMKCEG
jgi:glycosyltransferase involved in cell wall biosynthesis